MEALEIVPASNSVSMKLAFNCFDFFSNLNVFVYFMLPFWPSISWQIDLKSFTDFYKVTNVYWEKEKKVDVRMYELDKVKNILGVKIRWEFISFLDEECRRKMRNQRTNIRSTGQTSCSLKMLKNSICQPMFFTDTVLLETTQNPKKR